MAREKFESKNIRLLVGMHFDNSAAHDDARADISRAPVSDLGKKVLKYSTVNPDLTGAILLQGSIPGFLSAAQRMIYADNIFCYRPDPANPETGTPEDHHAPGLKNTRVDSAGIGII